MDDSSSLTPVQRLCRMGDAHGQWEWKKGNPDYVRRFGLGPEHIPELVGIARQWLDIDRPNDDVLYAPVHAWRALGQLRAVEAVEPLLAMQNQLHEEDDDWYLEEFKKVFALIGPPALPALKAYLADAENGEFPRISAADGVMEIGRQHPEARAEAVGILTDQLAKHETMRESLNGFLIAYLIDLNAVESAEVIERAFAANVIDEQVCGCWAEVRDELGVPGLGLASDRPRRPMFEPHFPAPKPHHFDYDPGLSKLERTREKMIRKQEKAERKRRKKTGKHNQK
jgi:hypothetical protein